MQNPPPTLFAVSWMALLVGLAGADGLGLTRSLSGSRTEDRPPAAANPVSSRPLAAGKTPAAVAQVLESSQLPQPDSPSVQDPADSNADPSVSDRPTRVVRFNLFGRNQEPVPRAKRPSFQSRDTERLYFADYYLQALQGAPPDWSSLPTTSGPAPITLAQNSPAEDMTAKPFDDLISAEVIEDLVKRQVNLLNTQITTPGRFRSEYSSVHQTFVQLAALFAVNEHYGQQVRWQDSAGVYRTMLARTAAGTRVGTEQAYQLATRSREELQQIMRGERPNSDVVVEPLEDWSSLLYRSPLMIWLESLALEEMRPLVGDDQQIRGNQAEILQQAEQIAMIAQLLLMPNMEGHDDAQYAKHARDMMTAVQELRAAYTRQDFSDVGTAANRIFQACDACHEDYR